MHFAGDLMKKLAVLCIAALGAAMLAMGFAPAAYAYPETTCVVDVAPQVLKPGEPITVNASVTAAVDAQNQPVPADKINWTFVFNGETKTRVGKDVQVTFTAPQVTKTTDFSLSAKASSPAGDCVHTFNITVVAPAVAGPHSPGGGGHHPSSGLPSTGGPAFWALVAGLVLLLGGGSFVVASRRRGDAT
jgi:LPXTG-motif cell wall-anchored protein